VRSANATNSTADRTSLDAEFQQLGAEINRTLSSTKFNGIAILAGGAGTQTFQVGANNGDTVTVSTNDMSTGTAIQTATAGSVTTVANANTAMTNLDSAISTVDSQRALYGAAQNRFEAVIGNLQVASENQSAARSRIMDADFAAETANLARAQILQQAGTAMVAQANQLPQQVLLLLKG
jgi:flagellin